MKYLALLLVSAAPIFAHHSFAAEFDSKKPITLKGTVTKLDWTNPHIWVHIDAKDDAGNVTQWMCEGGNPNTLIRAGWRKDTVKAGDQLTIEGFRAKDGTNTCNTRSVMFPDGKRVFAGSSSDGGPQQ
jgi:Family of unknown function (DUF6152)